MRAGLRPTWQTPPAALQLTGDAAHVWRAWLDVETSLQARLDASLSADEIARGTRFREPVDGRRWRVGRAFLRNVLARYTGQPPDVLTFTGAVGGKPALVGGGPAFNLAHSGSLALVAVAAHSPVGVDVEQIVNMPEMESIAARLMSARGYAAFTALEGETRRAAFFRYWTAYEALAKALGAGLVDEPASLAQLLDFTADGPIIHNRTTAEFWSSTSFVPAAGYAGALAIPVRLNRLYFWQWAASNE